MPSKKKKEKGKAPASSSQRTVSAMAPIDPWYVTTTNKEQASQKASSSQASQKANPSSEDIEKWIASNPEILALIQGDKKILPVASKPLQIEAPVSSGMASKCYPHFVD